MATDRRVPKKDSDFNQYIHNTDEALQIAGPPTGAARLGLTTDEADEWHDYRQQWDDLYLLYGNPDTRTKTITENKNNLKADFADFARPLLKRIEGSPNLTTSDRSTFNLPAPDTTPTARGPILEKPDGNFKGIGGAKLQVRAKRSTDANRASMHPLADAAEIKYLIIENRAEPTPPVPTPPGSEFDPDTFPHSLISSKALFVLNFTAAQQGKRIVAALRWLNLTNPANNSGWSDLFTTIIS